MAETLTFSNFAKTSLSAPMTEAGETAGLTDASVFPEGTFTAVIWDSAKASPMDDENREIVLATKSGNTLTAQRGREGTQARAWNVGSMIANVITADTLNTLIGASSGGDEIITVTDASYEMSPFTKKLKFVCSEVVPFIAVTLPSAAECAGSEFLLLNESVSYGFTVTLTPYGADTFCNLTGSQAVLYAGSSIRLISDGTSWSVAGFKSGSQSAKHSVAPVMDTGGMIFLPYAEVYAGAGLGMLHVDATETMVYVYVQTSDCMHGVPLTVIRTDNEQNTVFVPLANGVHTLSSRGDSVTVTADGDGNIFALSSYSAGGVVTFTEESVLTYGEKVVRCDASNAPFTVTSNYAHESAGRIITFIKTDSSENSVFLSLVTESDSLQIELTLADGKAAVISDGVNWHRLV